MKKCQVWGNMECTLGRCTECQLESNTCKSTAVSNDASDQNRTVSTYVVTESILA